MFDPMRDIREFHDHFNIAYRGKPRVLPAALAAFRAKFMREELKEYGVAIEAANAALKQKPVSFDDEVAYQLMQAMDALVDLTYVVLGTAHLHGFDFEEAWRRVHAANMAKVNATTSADSKRKYKHDIVKPAHWQAPRLRDLVSDHAHTE